jgi:hypothetical protein
LQGWALVAEIGGTKSRGFQHSDAVLHRSHGILCHPHPVPLTLACNRLGKDPRGLENLYLCTKDVNLLLL